MPAAVPPAAIGQPSPVPPASNVAGQTGGEPLLPAVGAAIERSVRVGLPHVRVHTDSKAQQIAHGHGARAVTYGHDIFLGPNERPTDVALMAHEVAHVIQQEGGAPKVQALGHDKVDPHEREAHQTAAAVVRGEPFVPRERTNGRHVQRFGLDDIPNYLAGKANMIPGFRMLTIILGMNPINMTPADASAANIIRALIEFLPGGGLLTQALDNSGVFEKVGAWVKQQIETLGITAGAIKKAVTDFVDTLSVTDIANLGDVWDRAERIFTGPIDQIINFAKGLITGIIQFVKDAILIPIAKLAQGTPGYDLLEAVLGKDPITDEKVPQTAETLIGPLMKLIGQEAVWENMQKAKAVPRAFAWFKGAMAAVVGFVSQIPTLFMNAFHELTLEDIILVPKAFAKLVGVFGNFVGQFITWASEAVWTLLELIFDVVSPGAWAYIKKTGAALRSILENPLPFVGNLVKAAKLGFLNFADHIGTHLKAGLIDWLTGSLEGVYIPTALNLSELGKFAISVLGISWAQIRGKIVKALGPTGETIMKVLETGFDIVVALVKGGPAAAWELVKEKLNDLKDQVVSGIIGFVTDTIVKKAIPKLISMFIPGAGFISAIISIYDTVMVFVEKVSKIIQAVVAFIDSIVAIASGNIAAAANRVESTLASLLSLAISFFAGFVGLGKVTDKIKEVIEKVRASVDKALDVAVAWVVEKAKALFASLFSKKEEPDERTEEEKTKDKLAGIAEAEKLVPERSFDEEKVRGKFGAIKTKYKLLTLDLVTDSKEGDTETIHFTASASEVEKGEQKEVKLAATLGEVTLSKPFTAMEKAATEMKLAMTVDEVRRQVGIQQAALNNLEVKQWKGNWNKFYGPVGGRADESGAAQARETAIAAERSKVIDLWLTNNPDKPLADANAFATQLFTRRPGDKAYPFLYKSLVFNNVSYVNPVYGQVILHAADQAAGGGTETAGLGGARENFSIGAQWSRGGRAEILRDQLETEIDNVGKTTDASEVEKMKLKTILPVEEG